MEHRPTIRICRIRIRAAASRAKRKDKLDLQKELGLPLAADVPLFGSITRLAEQKGLDIQLAALEEMLSANMPFTRCSAAVRADSV